MPPTRDLFFDEFYEELERVAGEMWAQCEDESEPLLAEDVQAIWRPYAHDQERRGDCLISVDGAFSTGASPMGHKLNTDPPSVTHSCKNALKKLLDVVTDLEWATRTGVSLSRSVSDIPNGTTHLYSFFL